MGTVRLTPSLLENYRKFKQGYEYATAEDIIDTVRGKRVWRPNMDFGSAFHAIIEHGHERYYRPETGLYRVFERGMQGHIMLTEEEITEAVRFRRAHPRMHYEVSGTFALVVEGMRVVFSLRVDGTEGMAVHENKTSQQAVKYDDWAESLQWKIYMLALRPDYVQYNIFHYKQNVGQAMEVDPLSFRLYPYHALDQEIEEWTWAFIQFARNQDILHLLVR